MVREEVCRGRYAAAPPARSASRPTYAEQPNDEMSDLPMLRSNPPASAEARPSLQDHRKCVLIACLFCWQSLQGSTGEHFGEQRTFTNIVRRCTANEHEHTPIGVFVVRPPCSPSCSCRKESSCCEPYAVVPHADPPGADEVLARPLECLLLGPFLI